MNQTANTFKTREGHIEEFTTMAPEITRKRVKGFIFLLMPAFANTKLAKSRPFQWPRLITLPTNPQAGRLFSVSLCEIKGGG